MRASLQLRSHYFGLSTAPSLLGLLDDTQFIDRDMVGKMVLLQNIEHNTRMVVSLGCADHFKKTLSVIKMMPSSNRPTYKYAHCPATYVLFENICTNMHTSMEGELLSNEGCTSYQRFNISYGCFIVGKDVMKGALHNSAVDGLHSFT